MCRPGCSLDFFVRGIRTRIGDIFANRSIEQKRILENHPNVPQVARVPAEEVVVWLLQRPAFETIFKDAAGVANVVMTTSLEDVVGIDISGAASYVIGVVSSVAPEVAESLQASLDVIQPPDYEGEVGQWIDLEIPRRQRSRRSLLSAERVDQRKPVQRVRIVGSMASACLSCLTAFCISPRL